MSPPSSCKVPGFTLGPCTAYSSTLKMGATCYSEKAIDSQLTIRNYIPEARNHYDHRCENLKSYNESDVLRYLEIFDGNYISTFQPLREKNCRIPGRGSLGP
jgi:hypothetical protein